MQRSDALRGASIRDREYRPDLCGEPPGQINIRLRSYRPEDLFDEQGPLKPELAELQPKGERRMGANPRANGGMLLRDLRIPDFRDYAVDVVSPGVRCIGDTHVLGRFLRDVAKLNSGHSETSGSLALTQRFPTAWKPSLRRPEANGMRGRCLTTNSSKRAPSPRALRHDPC
jgi:hypothetical protein